MGGSAALAVQTGAALMPATIWFEDDRWGVEIHKEIPVPAEGDRWHKAAAMTQEVARAFERAIREHPADWHMLQRVFVSDLDPDRLATARAKVAARQRAAQRGAGQHPEPDGQSALAKETEANGAEAMDAKEAAGGVS